MPLRSSPLTRVRSLLVAMWVMMLPAIVDGQQPDTLGRDRLPRDVAREVVALFNATTTMRASGRVEIEAGRTVPGHVAVLNGPVIIAGYVAGRVVAINADVLLRKGARIDGDLLVVGGEVEGSEGASIGGELRVYHPPLRYSREGDRLVAQLDEGTSEEQWWRRFEWGRQQSNSNRLEIATAGAYNRVEGLPVRVGPVLYRDQGWGHLRLNAGAILRTGSSFSSSTSDVGHTVRGELRIGREIGVTLGGRLFDEVEAVESWQLSNAEAGLAAFLFRRDYRDYYERHGGSVFAAIRASDNADLTLSYGNEHWTARDARNPPTIFGSDRSWRANPRADEGRFHLASVTLRVDTRNDVFNPWAGWYLLADFERGVGDLDALGATAPDPLGRTLGRTHYQRGFVDVRRYNRLAPSSALNLRIVMGGWLSGDPLPLERRMSIDGPGTVPGFDFRSPVSPDVGTCTQGVEAAGRPAQCERIALGQLEYRSDLRISFSGGADESRHTRFRADGAWVFFADGGRGWLVNAPSSALNLGRRDIPPLSSYRTDIGAGLDFDLFGLYVAKALSAPSEPTNVFVRIRHRF